MNIIIRKGTETDFPAVYALMQEFTHYQRTPEKLTITVQQMIQDKNLFQCFVAENTTKGIVGYACWFFSYYSWSGKALNLDDLYVQAAYRGQQVGTRLLNTIIDHARTTDCKKVRWQVSKWNEPAIGFYKKMGAVVDDVEMNCDLVL